MTENYGMVTPLMLACVLAFSVSRLLRPDSIYASSQRAKNATDPRLTTARELLRTDSLTAHPGEPVAGVEARLIESRWRNVYVVDADQRFLGAISMHELATWLKSPHDVDAPWPPELLRTDFPRLHADMPLWEVLPLFEKHPGERLPVVDGEGRLLGHVTKTDLVLMLRERLTIQ
jgi:CIC family chloride channel protein